jgi:flagellar protein FliO/FliZ
MYTALVLSYFIFASSVMSQSGSDQKELDQILRKELGVTDTKSKTENTSTDEKKTITEENPIQERYAENVDDSPSATWILLKILFVLAILVGAGYFLVQKMQVSKASRYPVKGFMKVLSTLSLSPNQSLQIVEVGNRLLVLGVADGAVSLVTEINSADEKSEINKMKAEADPYVPNFLETMLESLQSKAYGKKIRINKNMLESSDAELSADVQRKARESLERLRKHRELLEGGPS